MASTGNKVSYKEPTQHGEDRRQDTQASSKAISKKLDAEVAGMRDAPARIYDQTFQQRQPGLQALVNEGTTAREDMATSLFNVLSGYKSGQGGLAPNQILAEAVRATERATAPYLANRTMRTSYGDETSKIAERALQGQQMYLGGLQNQYQRYSTEEADLRARLFQKEQLQEQQRQFNNPSGYQQQSLAMEQQKFAENVRQFGMNYALQKQQEDRLAKQGNGSGAMTPAQIDQLINAIQGGGGQPGQARQGALNQTYGMAVENQRNNPQGPSSIKSMYDFYKNNYGQLPSY